MSDDKIKVLIVDDIPDTRDNLEKLLYFEQDIQVIGKAGTGREAVTMAKQLQPNIVLMDINMPDMDGIAATEELAKQVPMAQVIMMSVQGESDYLRRAMLAGAREFLTKPISGDELVNSIRHVYRRQPVVVVQPSGGGATPGGSDGGKVGEVIAVFSPKGGVGVTMLAANLAVALKLLRGNKKVALVDANLIFGDIGVVLNLISSKTITDLVSRINDLDQELINDVLATHNSGLKVLLPPPNPQEGELVNSDHLRVIVDKLRQEYDYVVIDTQSTFQDQTMTMLDLANKILLVMTMEMTTIKNIKQFLEVAELLEYDEDKLMLVLNKADGRLGMRVDHIEANLKHKVKAQVPNAALESVQSINQGVPLIMTKRDHPVVQEIVKLATLVAGLAPAGATAPQQQQQQAQPQQQQEEQRGGLFARLGRKK